MGSNVSIQSTDIINKTITDQSMKFMNETNVSTQSSLTAAQKMDVEVDVGGTVRNCDFNFAQAMEITSKVYSKLTAQNTADLARQVEEKVSTKAKDEVKQKLEGVNLGQFNTTINREKVNNYSFTDLSTTVANVITNKVNSAIDANQEQKIKVRIGGDFDCTDNGGFLVAQNIDIEAIIDASVQDEKVTELVNDFSKTAETIFENKTSQTSEGIDFMAIFVAIAAIVGLIVLVIIIKIMRK